MQGECLIPKPEDPYYEISYRDLCARSIRNGACRHLDTQGRHQSTRNVFGRRFTSASHASRRQCPIIRDRGGLQYSFRDRLRGAVHRAAHLVSRTRCRTQRSDFTRNSRWGTFTGAGADSASPTRRGRRAPSQQFHLRASECRGPSFGHQPDYSDDRRC